MATYLDEKFSFDDAAARAYMKEAFELEGKQLSGGEIAEFLNDLLMSVCVLQRDGAEIQFSHRSFQEYFCATYICGCAPNLVSKLLDQIVARAFLDRTLALIRDMSPEIFDRQWTVPRLAQIIAKIDDLDPYVDAKAYMGIFCNLLIVHREPQLVRFSIKGKMGSNWALINMIYGLGRRAFTEQVFEELYNRKLDIIAKYMGQPRQDSPRLVYSIEDLKPEMVRALLEVDGALEGKVRLVKLHEELKSKYDKKDERMNRLIAKVRK